MPQYQFLDRIVNTVSLQTKPTNRFKKLNNQLFMSVGSLLIQNQLNSSTLNSLKFPLFVNNDQSLLTQKSIEPLVLDTEYYYSYFNSSASLTISENYNSSQESSTGISISFFPESTIYSLTPSYEGNSLLFNVQETADTYTLVSNISTTLINSQTSTISTYIEEAYETYPLGYSYSGIITTPSYLYIPKANDDMLLALDLEFNQIFQYIEPQDVEEYVPPNPEDLTIITLKEFWG